MILKDIMFLFSKVIYLTQPFILQDADKKGLSRIAEEVKQLAQKAKEGSLKPDDYEVSAMLCMKQACIKKL